MGAGWKRTAFKAGLNALYYTGMHQALSPVSRGVGLILMLHRVLPSHSNGFQPNAHLEITPEFLTAVVEKVQEMGLEIVGLDTAHRRLEDKESGERFAVLTFDDGYVDNFELALPILKKFGAPFTVFVASGMIDRTTELWWLALERIIARQKRIELALDGQVRGFDCSEIDGKYKAFRQLSDHLTEISEHEQRRAIRKLAKRYDFDLSELCDDVAMTWDDVRELTAEPLVTIGAHTHDHHAIRRLTAEEAASDIQKGVTRLTEETGRQPMHFAYPYGSHYAAGPRDFGLVAELGFKTAVTTRPGVLFGDHAAHLTALPRVSLNGHFQDLKYLDLFLTGAPFALFNRFQRVNAA